MGQTSIYFMSNPAIYLRMKRASIFKTNPAIYLFIDRVSYLNSNPAKSLR